MCHSPSISSYKPSSLHTILRNAKTKPKKALSQNFLIDQNILKKIIQISGVKPGDTILEIGPGAGSLTEALLKEGAKVIAIEKDSHLAHALPKHTHLKVYEADIINFDLSLLLPMQEKIKVISNLPYHLTAPILSKLLPEFSLFSTLTLMVQKEVGERMIAKTHQKTYSSFSLFCQYHADVNYAFTISPNCFYPRPKIDSCLVHFQLKKSNHDPAFFKFIRKAFGQKRKMLRASLGEEYGKAQIQQLLKELGFSSEARPQDLALEDFLLLFLKIKNPTGINPNSQSK